MDTRRCLKIAERMHALLLHELGQGVDGLRMVAEPVYARDVLLVCDAMPGTELAELAQQFRVAATERAQPESTASPRPSGGGSGRGRPHAGARTGVRHGAVPGPDEGPAQGTDAGARNGSGFGASAWSRLASGFGFSVPGGISVPDSQPEAPTGSAAQPPPRRWFSPSRWRDGK